MNGKYDKNGTASMKGGRSNLQNSKDSETKNSNLSAVELFTA